MNRFDNLFSVFVHRIKQKFHFLVDEFSFHSSLADQLVKDRFSRVRSRGIFPGQIFEILRSIFENSEQISERIINKNDVSVISVLSKSIVDLFSVQTYVYHNRLVSWVILAGNSIATDTAVVVPFE